MTRWRWVTVSEDLNLTLTLDSDDPEMIERVEFAAREQHITLVRLDDDDGEAVGVREPAPLPPDYWETAQ